MGKTLWQRWTEKPEKPVEVKFYDPLGVKVGGSITINELDYRDYNFFLQEIREYTRPELGEQHSFTDYVLVARPIGGEDKTVRIRCFNKPNPADGMPFQPVLLEQYDSLAYDEGLHNVVKDTTGKFQVNDNGKLQAEYYRPTVGSKPLLREYTAKVNVITKLLKEGVADGGLPSGNSPIVKEELEYWDYSRTIKDEANQDVEEYVFVEMNKDNGWFTIWKGVELSPHEVVLM